MGDNGEAGGSLPNGLLPGANSVMRELDLDRWSRVEKRTDELIASIQPNQLSEDRRSAVADYVQRLIMKCFPCQVCTFGSVPLKTYLPDGDIDLTAFSQSENMKDTWADLVRDSLEREEKNADAEFHVKEVQYIQAEVKLIKCLVENIVVDISFNQVGGLCTLCFLDQVDSLISQNHLFKRSIILIKAWCYYESRILGAHHGLISTYALETLVLYIFHVFNNSFHGPLEVLYRFLEFFSNFDWDNFCLSLWGPVPISSLPNVTAEHPRKDRVELLLSKVFLDACSFVYAVYPGGQENNGQPFVSKHFNVIDPLRVSNNLGRSVSKGNFYRIRSAFAFGARKLARLLDCPKENLIFEVNQFFMNTWERHGSGHRPDAPGLSSWRSGLSNPGHLQEFNDTDKNTRDEKVNGNTHINKMEGDRTRGSSVSSKQGKSSSRMLPIRSKSTAATQTHNLKSQFSSLMISDQNGKQTASPHMHNDEVQRDLRVDHLVNVNQGRFLFSRIHSSPELTDDFDGSSQPRRGKEASNAHISNGRLDSNNRKNNLRSESLASHSRRSSVEDNSSMKHLPSQRSFDVTPDSNIDENTYHQKFGVDTSNDKFSSPAAQIRQQEEQDVANMLPSASLQGFNSQVHVPFNFPPGHLPFPIHPSFLASMGYGQRNLPGFLPSNIPLIDQSFPGMQFPQGLVSPQMTHYSSGTGLNMPSEDPVERSSKNFNSVEMNSREVASDSGQEKDLGSPRGYDPDNGNFNRLQSDYKPAASSNSLYIPPFRLNVKGQQKYPRKKGGSLGKNIGSLPTQEIPQRRDIRSSDVYAEERSASSRLSSASHSNSIRSRTSSESSWDGSVKLPKSTKEKRGKKVVPTELAIKGKIMSEHVPDQANDGDQAWGSSYSVSSETSGRNLGSEPVASLQVRGHHIPDSEIAQTSDSVPPFAPMVIGHDSRRRIQDSNGLIAFYPTGPPIPFLTMLPIYNVPPETDRSDASRADFGDDEPSGNSISGQNFSSRRFEQSEDLHSSSTLQDSITIEHPEERKSDILNSDFASHWQNLQFGRLCQQPRHPGPSNYPSPLMVPPVYLQGQFPYDNTGRPLATNSNMFSQLVSSYGPRLVPVSPQSASARPPPNVYHQYMDEMPRYRSGTGTYLPDPVALRERQSSGSRRGNYNHDRNANFVDREGNWNSNSRSRGAASNHGRTQTDRSNSRTDRPGPAESRAERAWSSLRHDPTSYRSEDGSLRQNGPESLSYGMYASPATTHTGLPNGHVPPVMMTYHPFDQNGTYDPHSEQLEFDSLSPVGFSATTEELEPNEGTRSRTYEDHRVNRNSRHRFSPDLPSSPHHQRRI